MASEDSRTFRTDPRFRAALRVRLGGGGAETAQSADWATTRDVGAGGAFLRCDKPFEPGTRLRLIIEPLDDGPSLEVEAEVKWCAPADAPEPGLGVRFVQPSAELRRRIEALVEAGELPIFELYE
ncbi:MAG: PilZ domain-containing protein [bacterium]